MGLQSTPANLILISLSLFMTFYVMAPTFDQAWNTGANANTQAATNIAARGEVHFSSDTRPGNNGNGNGNGSGKKAAG